MALTNDYPTIRPSLLLDFARSRALDPRITFTRASIATRVNEDGLVETVESGVPRFDFDPVTLTSKGLLIEEQRTNSFTYSDDFNNAAWSKTNAKISSNAIIAPDGTLTGDKLYTGTAAASAYRITQTFSATSGTAYTASFFIKSGELSNVSIYAFSIFTGSNAGAVFNTSTGTVVFTSGATATISAVGNGWYRCSITVTPTSTGTASITVRLSDGSSSLLPALNGNDWDGVYIWGAQLEAGAFATSYIPTTSASVTRNADAASMTGTNFSSWYRADEGTLFLSASSFGSTSANRRAAFIADGSTSNRVGVLFNSSNRAQLLVSAAGSIQANPELIGVSLTSPTLVAAVYKVNDFAITANASTVGTDTSGNLPTTNDRLSIGSQDGVDYINGNIRKLAFYPRRLTNAELQALTTV